MRVAAAALSWLLPFWLLGAGPAQATRPPNYYLGTCLDATWVAEMETELGTSHTARDSDGRLKNPFLQPAPQYPRYQVCIFARYQLYCEPLAQRHRYV